MVNRRLRLLLVASAAIGAAFGVNSAELPVRELTLDNGMRLLLLERRDAPTVSAGWVSHVGSVNETAGMTGIAHLFEHMMFKGTTTIGTTAPAAEAEIMKRLDAVRAEMEQEYSRLRDAKRRGEVVGSIYLPENQTERLAELRSVMTELQEALRELLIKEQYDQIFSAAGASGVNAFTTHDLTAFFATVPANKVELWFWMESDRLLDPVFREFYLERDVVREERRMRVESDPTARYDEQFDSMFWASIPYHHPVVGWPSDVESINREQAEQFFADFYAPNNITVALVGDFETARAVDLAKRYFGRIPRAKKPPPEMITEEIEQIQERRMVVEADSNPEVRIRWHGVPFVHRDVYALDVLSDVLSDRTGRLYRSLVEERRLAAGEPYAYNEPLRHAGLFEVGAEVASGRGHREVEAALLAEIERLKKEPIGERELRKVKNQSVANSYRRLRSNMALLYQLLLYDGLGDWRYLYDSAEKIQAVTADDVVRAANTYFPATGRNVLWYSRQSTAEEDPEIDALSEQARLMAKQTLAQIETINDPEELEQILDQMRAESGSLPFEFQHALELIIRRTEARIDELRAAGGEEG